MLRYLKKEHIKTSYFFKLQEKFVLLLYTLWFLVRDLSDSIT